MRAAGLGEIERAKADGRWQAASPGPASAGVPDDLAEALAAKPAAQAMFDRLTSQNRYAILHRIEAVRRPETRARKIAEFVAMLARGETVHPQTRRNKDQPGLGLSASVLRGHDGTLAQAMGSVRAVGAERPPLRFVQLPTAQSRMSSRLS